MMQCLENSAGPNFSRRRPGCPRLFFHQHDRRRQPSKTLACLVQKLTAVMTHGSGFLAVHKEHRWGVQDDRDVLALQIVAACVRNFDLNLFASVHDQDLTTMAFEGLLRAMLESVPRLLDKRPVFLTSYVVFWTTMAPAAIRRIAGSLCTEHNSDSSCRMA